jgi:hypothetical protein
MNSDLKYEAPQGHLSLHRSGAYQMRSGRRAAHWAPGEKARERAMPADSWHERDGCSPATPASAHTLTWADGAIKRGADAS